MRSSRPVPAKQSTGRHRSMGGTGAPLARGVYPRRFSAGPTGHRRAAQRAIRPVFGPSAGTAPFGRVLSEACLPARRQQPAAAPLPASGPGDGSGRGAHLPASRAIDGAACRVTCATIWSLQWRGNRCWKLADPLARDHLARAPPDGPAELYDPTAFDNSEALSTSARRGSRGASRGYNGTQHRGRLFRIGRVPGALSGNARLLPPAVVIADKSC